MEAEMRMQFDRRGASRAGIISSVHKLEASIRAANPLPSKPESVEAKI
jgi:hypothetical protein